MEVGNRLLLAILWTWAEEDVVKVCHLLPVSEQTTIWSAPPRMRWSCRRSHCKRARTVMPRQLAQEK